MKSLRSRLVVLWFLSLAVTAAAAVLLMRASNQSAEAKVARGEAVVARACDLIRDRYNFYGTGWSGPVPPPDDPALRQSLDAVVALALGRWGNGSGEGFGGVVGGLWQSGTGPLTSWRAPPVRQGWPWHDGTEMAPAAQPDADTLARLGDANAAALRDDLTVVRSWNGDAREDAGSAVSGVPRAAGTGSNNGSGADLWRTAEPGFWRASGVTHLLAACPLPGPIPGLTAWAMTAAAGVEGDHGLQIGLAVLLALVLVLSFWLLWLLRDWSRRVGRVEAALAVGEERPRLHLPLPGERDLDRIVGALNQAGARLAEVQARSEALQRRVADSERLAALGRVAAGLAHEIRNPLAAMRLKAENALAGDEARRVRALEAVLTQVRRLDGLLRELLTMTQRHEPVPEEVRTDTLFAACLDAQAERAAAGGVALQHEGTVVARLDPALLARALDSLLDNALRHTAPGGVVWLRAAARDGGMLAVTVENSVAPGAAGVDPALRDTLFEPFVTGRPEGTGLGLAIARELVAAQGGELRLDAAGDDGMPTRFLLLLPDALPERMLAGEVPSHATVGETRPGMPAGVTQPGTASGGAQPAPRAAASPAGRSRPGDAAWPPS